MSLDVESVSTYERFKMAPISTRTALKMYKDTRSSRTKTTELEYASVPCSYYDWQTVCAVDHKKRINNGEVIVLGVSKNDQVLYDPICTSTETQLSHDVR